MIGKLNHINIVTRDLHRCAVFYERLGLTRGKRPNFDTDGIWMYLGDHPMVHLNEPTAEELAHPGCGPCNHVGFDVHGSIAEVTSRLNELGIDYDLWEPLPGANRALYFEGPSGEKIEFVFVDVKIPTSRDVDIRMREPALA